MNSRIQKIYTIIGFTGTRYGMSENQKTQLKNILSKYNFFDFHHGDCIGADKDAHNIVTNFKSKIIIHPGYSQNGSTFFRAYCEGDVYLKPETHLKRNRNIVNACDLLIAAPLMNKEFNKGGTWYTINTQE